MKLSTGEKIIATLCILGGLIFIIGAIATKQWLGLLIIIPYLAGAYIIIKT